MCLDKGNGNAWFCIFMTHNKNGCTCSNNGKCQFNQIYLLNLELGESIVILQSRRKSSPPAVRMKSGRRLKPREIKSGDNVTANTEAERRIFKQFSKNTNKIGLPVTFEDRETQVDSHVVGLAPTEAAVEQFLLAEPRNHAVAACPELGENTAQTHIATFTDRGKTSMIPSLKTSTIKTSTHCQSRRHEPSGGRVAEGRGPYGCQPGG